MFEGRNFMKSLIAGLLLMIVASDGLAMDKVYHTMLDANLSPNREEVIIEVLKLSDGDIAIFSPIYREYQEELGRINDRRLILTQEFAAIQVGMSHEMAEVMIEQFLELEEKEFEVRQKCLERIEDKLSPHFAAVFYHVDTKLNLMVNLQMATKLPFTPAQ
jgi:hypothetical protein